MGDISANKNCENLPSGQNSGSFLHTMHRFLYDIPIFVISGRAALKICAPAQPTGPSPNHLRYSPIVLAPVGFLRRKADRIQTMADIASVRRCISSKYSESEDAQRGLPSGIYVHGRIPLCLQRNDLRIGDSFAFGGRRI